MNFCEKKEDSTSNVDMISSFELKNGSDTSLTNKHHEGEICSKDDEGIQSE
jgi:hypothetical protein